VTPLQASDSPAKSGTTERLSPPDVLAQAVGGAFHETGEEFLRHFVELGGLEPHHRVLDVGCGVGRMAVPLMGFLDARGRYDGFDVMADTVGWCQANIAPRDARFRFQRVDLQNRTYNRAGAAPASSFSFPYADGSFDFVFLTSVFTHMLPDDVRRYLSEIARVLAPGGRVLSTFFLLNAESLALIRSGLSPLFPFRHLREECRVMNDAQPEDAVAYDEDRVRAWYDARGLAWTRRPIYGTWCTRLHGLSLQDIVVARKA
jgi:SAM-dependent methyltransferase